MEGGASIQPVTAYRNSTADSPDITTAYDSSGEGDCVNEKAEPSVIAEKINALVAASDDYRS